MVANDVLQGFVLGERILDAVDFVPTVENRRPPAPDSGENRPVRRDKDRRGDGLFLQPDGVVELVYYTGPAKFLQCGVRPQLFWRMNNRTPFQPTRRGRIERLRRDCRENLYGSRT